LKAQLAASESERGSLAAQRDEEAAKAKVTPVQKAAVAPAKSASSSSTDRGASSDDAGAGLNDWNDFEGSAVEGHVSPDAAGGPPRLKRTLSNRQSSFSIFDVTSL